MAICRWGRGLVDALAVGLELVGDLLFGRRGQQADHDDRRKAEHEAGHDLIQVEDAAGKLRPDQVDHAADDDAGQRALAGGALPEQRAQHQRAEGRAEARPCVGYEAEHRAFRVRRDQRGDDRNGDDADAADPHQLLRARVLADLSVVEVLRDRGSRDEELAVRRGHDGREDRGQEDAGDKDREDMRDHRDIDGFLDVYKRQELDFPVQVFPV